MTNLPVVEATKQFYEITNYPARSYLDNPETHFLAGNYDKILENINGLCYNQVKVLQDFSSCIYWSNKIGAENVYYWHPDKNFLKEVGKTGVNIIADKNMVPHIPQVGNLNFSKAEDTYLNLCLDRELCFVMPAWVAVAPNWKGAGWHKKSDIKKNLEDNGLKELHWIPNGTFEQMLEDGKTKDAQVDSVLVITEPGYAGDVTVYDLNDNTSYSASRGGIYPRKQLSAKLIDRNGIANNLDFKEDQYHPYVVKNDEYFIGVSTYNPNAKGSGYNGPHLKGLKLFQPGDIIPKVWCRQSFTSLKDAEDMLAKLTDDDMANAYQMITTKKTFSNIFIKMLKV
jgi:hypothetical protein|tara:strand:+ start:2292 stop:3311 length:1020 start_codon:yes stop_codon:yes gene_type:complete